MRYLIILIFCSLFWNCADDTMPFMADENSLGGPPAVENAASLYLTKNQYAYIEAYSINIRLVDVFNISNDPIASLEIENFNEIPSSLNLRLNEEKIIASYYDKDYHNFLHIKIAKIDEPYKLITLYYWETHTKYGTL